MIQSNAPIDRNIEKLILQFQNTTLLLKSRNNIVIKIMQVLGFSNHSIVFVARNPDKTVERAVKIYQLLKLNNIEKHRLTQTMDSLMMYCNQDIYNEQSKIEIKYDFKQVIKTHEYQIKEINSQQYLLVIQDYAHYGTLSNYVKYFADIEQVITMKQKDPDNIQQFSPVTNFEIMMKILLAVVQLHEQLKICHGGLKMQNIFITDLSTLSIKIGDIQFSQIGQYINSKLINQKVADQYNIYFSKDNAMQLNVFQNHFSLKNLRQDCQDLFVLFYYLLTHQDYHQAQIQQLPPLPEIFKCILEYLYKANTAENVFKVLKIDDFLFDMDEKLRKMQEMQQPESIIPDNALASSQLFEDYQYSSQIGK